MVAKFLDEVTWKSIRTISNFTDLIQFHLIWQNFPWDSIYRYLSLEKESDNNCVVFSYSIKGAREIRKFYVVVVQRRQRNVQNSVMHVQSCCLLFINIFFLPFSSPSLSSLVLLSSRNIATMVTWRHTSPLCFTGSKIISDRDSVHM